MNHVYDMALFMVRDSDGTKLGQRRFQIMRQLVAETIAPLLDQGRTVQTKPVTQPQRQRNVRSRGRSRPMRGGRGGGRNSNNSRSHSRSISRSRSGSRSQTVSRSSSTSVKSRDPNAWGGEGDNWSDHNNPKDHGPDEPVFPPTAEELMNEQNSREEMN